MADDGLFSVLLEIWADLIRYLHARGVTPHDAEDILQDLDLRLEAAGPAVEEPRAYLFRMAHNLFLDRRRSELRRQVRERSWGSDGTGDSEEGMVPAADEALMASQGLRLIAGALDALPDRSRDIFYRFRIHGQTQREIAAALQLSKSAVEKHLYRAYVLVARARAALEGDATKEVARRHESGRVRHDD